MLDASWNTQSSGLRWHTTAGPGLRVLGIIPSGEAADMHALTQACVLLQHQGYPVVVLDGTESETPQAPGLQELLQPQSGLAHTALPSSEHDPSALACLPAARGMVQLAHYARNVGQTPLASLHRHLRNHALVVLVAPAPLLAPLLVNCQQAPWLLIPSQRNSVLQCYRQLKHLYMHTGLMPRLLALRPSYCGLDPLLKSVALCALHYLHNEPLALQIDPDNPRQLQRWSLQSLEQAETVHAPLHSGFEPLLNTSASTAPPVWNH